MRKFKFRIWHKVEKRWLNPWSEEDPILSLKDFGNGCDVFLYDRDRREHSNINCRMEDIIIQQYTGIKDKNGVEIYEGDIIQHFAFEAGDTRPVEFDQKNGEWSCYGTFSELSRCEVVGNIYEHVRQ